MANKTATFQDTVESMSLEQLQDTIDGLHRLGTNEGYQTLMHALASDRQDKVDLLVASDNPSDTRLIQGAVRVYDGVIGYRLGLIESLEMISSGRKAPEQTSQRSLNEYGL